MNKDSKIAVLIHGYPEPIHENHSLYRYFSKEGYAIISLYLFSSKFKLTQEDVKKYVDRGLNGREPDVIVGVSLGGLIAPYLAKDFLGAKLVLIATGPYVRKKIPIALLPPIQWLIVHMPVWIYSIVYKLFNRQKIKPEERKKLEEHIEQNWGHLKNISLNENKEVIDFLTTTDNRKLLQSLGNETMIIAGNDNLMPLELSMEMKSLIKRSTLVSSGKRLHFEVFSEANYQQLTDFLN